MQVQGNKGAQGAAGQKGSQGADNQDFSFLGDTIGLSSVPTPGGLSGLVMTSEMYLDITIH